MSDLNRAAHDALEAAIATAAQDGQEVRTAIIILVGDAGEGDVYNSSVAAQVNDPEVQDDSEPERLFDVLLQVTANAAERCGRPFVVLPVGSRN